MYETILIPTDGSEGASRGVDHGLNIADKYEAAVYALYVIDSRIYGDSAGVSTETEELSAVRDIGEEAVASVADRARELGLDAETALVEGVPYEAIVRYAEDNGVDLIVMGIHGKSAVKRPHIGSVTDRVIRTTEIPVLPV